MSVYLFLALVFIPSVLSQTSTSVTLSLVTITPLPTPTPSALPQGFVGYSTEPVLGGYSTWWCPAGQIWSQIGNYAGCCDGAPYVECAIATACLNTSLMVGPGGQQTWSCTGTGPQTVCITGIVYPSAGATHGVVTNVQCGWPAWNGGNWDATRYIPGLSGTGSASPITTTTASTTTSVPLASSTSSTSHQASNSSLSGTTPSPSRKLSTGDIIGIALGVFVAIAICLILYKFRRHMNFSHRHETVEPDPTHHGDSQLPTAEVLDQPGRTEHPTQQAVQELPGQPGRTEYLNQPVPELHVEMQ